MSLHPRPALCAILILAFVCGCAPRTKQARYDRANRASVFFLDEGRHHGSGFIASPDGLVVTAAHMMKGNPDALEVISPVLGRLKVTRVAVDPAHDIALLRLPPRAKAYPFLNIADRVPPPGSAVYLFGDPIFRHRMLLTGSIAHAGPTFCYSPGTGCYVRSFYVAGTSPKGTSGGCWLDDSGRVLGVQSGYLNSAKAPAMIANVAVPDGVRALLAAQQSPETATLGAQLEELWTQSKGFIKRFPSGTQGVLTVVPVKDGPVAKAGLNKESLVTAIDGQTVSYVDDLLAAVRARTPGDTVTLRVQDPDKGDKTRDVAVTLGKLN
ncbi:serine protease [bacterium]|nr:serine protease [bacterium]